MRPSSRLQRIRLTLLLAPRSFNFAATLLVSVGLYSTCDVPSAALQPGVIIRLQDPVHELFIIQLRGINGEAVRSCKPPPSPSEQARA